MNARVGHIATIIIAALFALLLFASLLPPGHAPQDDINNPPPLLFTGLGERLTHHEPEIAPTVASTAPSATHRNRTSTSATVGSTGIASPYIPVKPKTDSQTEDHPVDAKSIFFDVRLTDLVIIALLAMIWWNAWRIWDKIRNYEADYNDPLREGDRADDAVRFDRAAAAMELLAQALATPKPAKVEPERVAIDTAIAAAVTPAVPVKRGRKPKRAPEDLLGGTEPGPQ